MKVINELKARKTPIVTIDKSLNQLDNKILFPEKLEKANKMLKEIGLPKLKNEK
ncbi:hypothetical protein ACFFUE_05800 [Bergeyella porcorum]|uniref:hypothetical protein n=1 Tax=Bergeyella porcorum TaxID=1735111 RepID=UPI0035E8645D